MGSTYCRRAHGVGELAVTGSALDTSAAAHYYVRVTRSDRPADRNPFLAYLATHPGADRGALKELFRVLAKRTHPDLGAESADDFVRLQECYHEALARIIAEESRQREPDAVAPRDRVFRALYRYKALLPGFVLEPRELPPACMHAFAAAMEAARSYTPQADGALSAFHEQFHENRRLVARYPDVRTKYSSLLRGIAGFFDHSIMPGRFNERVTRSYLAEIRPVTDVDPSASPDMRHNRSAAARSALYRMRTWLEAELEAEPPGVA